MFRLRFYCLIFNVFLRNIQHIGPLLLKLCNDPFYPLWICCPVNSHFEFDFRQNGQLFAEKDIHKGICYQTIGVLYYRLKYNLNSNLKPLLRICNRNTENKYGLTGPKSVHWNYFSGVSGGRVDECLGSWVGGWIIMEI